LQGQDLQVKTHAQEKGEGEGEKRKRDLVDEDDEDMTSSGSSSEEEDSGSYDNMPPKRDKRPCDAKGQHYVLQQESLNDPQENVDDDELAVKHVSLQLLVFGESLSLMHTNLYQHRLLLSCTWTPTKFGGKNGKYQNIMHVGAVELWSAHSKTHCHLILYCNAIVVPDF